MCRTAFLARPLVNDRGMRLSAIALRNSILFALACLTIDAGAQTELEVQAPNTGLGIDIAGPVYQAGSDEASAAFMEDVLPVLLDFVNENLNETSSLSDVAGIALDPESLALHTESDVRVYFVGEGAGYHNTLGYTSESVSGEQTAELLVFPDASSALSYFKDADTDVGDSFRNSSTPVLPGDFVDLGTFDAGTQLDFFLIANGAFGGNNTYTADADSNPDGIQHVVSFAIEGSSYLLVGFEDLYGGGDRDFNDLVFAVDIGSANVSYLATPEPSTWILMALFALGILYLKSARSRRAQQ
jgi:hypothetical protein